MNFEEYQKQAATTAIYPDIGKNPFYPALGLMGEAGEVANKIKKIMRDDKGEITVLKRKEILSELGDVLWYLSALCDEFDISLKTVAEKNIEKLASRKTRNKINGEGDNR